MTISNSPPKGTSDWWPDEYTKRKYIFDTWRSVNRQFGYEEYLTPMLESAEVYRAKSGEDVGGKELMTMIDRAGRELAIRPEMTPSVTRMVTRFYKQAPKPLRLFSIANYYRNERPQRGRNREFWQLNTDIFGSTSLWADLEILQVALELMLAFNPPAGSFVLQVNHRQLIDAALAEAAQLPEELITPTVRLLDKYGKIGKEKFIQSTSEIGLSHSAIDALIQFIECRSLDDLLANFPLFADNKGYQDSLTLLQSLNELGYGDWITFNASIIRGFDYYDGMVFEIFDNHPQNNRALFGGGRYNGLANIFGSEDIPAVGFAPGDETTRIFLESWNLLPSETADPKTIYFPLFDESLMSECSQLAHTLRRAGYLVELGVEQQSFKQALSYANNKGVPIVLILGSNEAAANSIVVKNMISGEQEIVAQADLVAALSK